MNLTPTAVAVDDLDRAREGNRDALAVLLIPLLDPAYRLAMAILRRREAAEDAVQDACFKAIRAIGRFEGDRERLRPWFLTIVANQCRSHIRRPIWRWLPLSETEVDPGRSVEDQVTRGADLRRELGRLDREQRLVLALFYHLDLPMEEVAAVLGVSVSAARSRLYRAVGALRERLGEAEELP